MSNSYLLLELGLYLVLVFSPAVITGLALQRVLASRSRNRLLYGLVALVAGGVAFRILADVLAAVPLDPGFVLAAMAAPVGWGIILWVVAPSDYGLYIERRYWRLAGAAEVAPLVVRPRSARAVKEAVRMNERKNAAGWSAAGQTQKPRLQPAETGWSPERSLPFVPRAESG